MLVRDFDEALRFYTGVLGLEKRQDQMLPGGGRWITVAPFGAKGTEICLQRPDPAWYGEEGARQLLDRVGQGTTWVFATKDCDFAHRELSSRGVHFDSPPTKEPYGVEAVFLDLYGNRFSLLQRS